MRKYLLILLLYPCFVHGQVTDTLYAINVESGDTIKYVSSYLTTTYTDGDPLLFRNVSQHKRGVISPLSLPVSTAQQNAINLRATITTTDSMRTNIYNALNGKQAAGSYATTAQNNLKVNISDTAAMQANDRAAILARATVATTDSMRTNIYNALNVGVAATALKAPTASPTFTGTVTLPSGQALVAPVLGTPASGNLANCTFPTLNQSTTGSAATLTTARTINFKSFNGSANIISSAIVANTSVVTGTAARTITGAQIVAGNIQELTGTTGRTFTFDTGTNMSTAAGTVTVGDTYYILIKCSGTSTGTITLAGATGMTLSSSAVIAIGTSRMCAVINVGTNAWTVY